MLNKKREKTKICCDECLVVSMCNKDYTKCNILKEEIMSKLNIGSSLTLGGKEND